MGVTPAAPDVVLTLSNETWDDMARRSFIRPPDRLARHLLTSGDVGSLLIVNPWRSVGRQAARRLRGRPSIRFDSRPGAYLHRPMRLAGGFPTSVAAVPQAFRRYDRTVRRAAAHHQLHRPALITFSPFHAAYAELSGYRTVTYVGRDDWAAYPPHRHLWPAYHQAYGLIRQRALRVSAVSQVLMDRIRPLGPNVVVPNGIDPAVWSGEPFPADSLASLPRPLAVYSGTIDRRLSLPALAAIASCVGSLVLVGPQDPAYRLELQQAIPDITFMASVSPPELARIVAAADVCVIPHVRSELTEAMSPLKIYEYLAAGRPVVSTDLAPVRHIHPLVELVDGPDEEFASAVKRAMDLPAMTSMDRAEFIDANRWSTRCEQILNLALQS